MLYIVKKNGMLVSGEHVGVVMGLEGRGVGGLVVAWRIFTVLHLDIYLHRHLPTSLRKHAYSNI